MQAPDAGARFQEVLFLRIAILTAAANLALDSL